MSGGEEQPALAYEGKHTDWVVADAHVHMRDCFDLGLFFDNAVRNFRQEARRNGVEDRFSGLGPARTEQGDGNGSVPHGPLVYPRWGTSGKHGMMCAVDSGRERQLARGFQSRDSSVGRAADS